MQRLIYGFAILAIILILGKAVLAEEMTIIAQGAVVCDTEAEVLEYINSNGTIVGTCGKLTQTGPAIVLGEVIRIGNDYQITVITLDFRGDLGVQYGYTALAQLTKT